jgi:hypothetical protein
MFHGFIYLMVVVFSRVCFHVSICLVNGVDVSSGIASHAGIYGLKMAHKPRIAYGQNYARKSHKSHIKCMLLYISYNTYTQMWYIHYNHVGYTHVKCTVISFLIIFKLREVFKNERIKTKTEYLYVKLKHVRITFGTVRCSHCDRHAETDAAWFIITWALGSLIVMTCGIVTYYYYYYYYYFGWGRHVWWNSCELNMYILFWIFYLITATCFGRMTIFRYIYIYIYIFKTVLR